MPDEAQIDLASQTGSDVWASPAWRALALAWVDEQLTAAGQRRTGDVENDRVRAWSTVFSVPTTAGRVWFKAAGPATAFEVPLYQLMHRVVPESVLAPIAADATRGWILLPDGGPPLADYLSGPELVDSLTKVLPRYGQMQRDLAPHAPDMLAIGVPDMRPELMPRRFNRALVAVNRHVSRYGRASARVAFRRLTDLSPTFDSWCERLAALPIAATLDHNDLHPYNILVAETTGITGAKVFDWGDSVLAHPFTSLLIPLRWAQYEYGVSHDDSIIQRLRDAYLEPFGDLAPHAELVAAVELACRLGMVTRALAWAAAANDAGSQGRGHRKRAFEWLTYLLEDSYLGRV